MTNKNSYLPDELRFYLLNVSVPEHGVLAALRRTTAALPGHRMQIPPEQGAFMALLIRSINARRVLEVGVFTGYSTLSMALALPSDGSITACDIDKEHTDIACEYWRQANVASLIDLKIAPALKTLDNLLKDGMEGSYDFSFIDADKENYDLYYEKCLRLIQVGGLIVVDNVLWGGKVADASVQDADTRAIRAFNSKLKMDDRIHLSVLPLADGLTLAQKN